MDKTLIIFALLSALNMVATPILAFYAIHVIRKYKRAMYREGYYQGFIEGQMQGFRDDDDAEDDDEEESGMRKDCIHCEACARHEFDYYKCPNPCAQYERREK